MPKGPSSAVKPRLWLSPSPKRAEPQLTALCPAPCLPRAGLASSSAPHPVQSLPSARSAASPEKAEEAQAVLDCDHDHVPVGGQGGPVVGGGGASHERAPVEPHHDLRRRPWVSDPGCPLAGAGRSGDSWSAFGAGVGRDQAWPRWLGGQGPLGSSPAFLPPRGPQPGCRC